MDFKQIALNALQAQSDCSGECWLFNGALSSDYGVICIDGIAYRAHRLSAHIYFNLDLENGAMQVNHVVSCLNRNCWRPDHIYIGTSRDNMLDRQAMGRGPQGLWGNSLIESKKTHCPKNHEYTLENTKYQGNKRKCRECERMRKRGLSKPKNLTRPYRSTKLGKG